MLPRIACINMQWAGVRCVAGCGVCINYDACPWVGAKKHSALALARRSYDGRIKFYLRTACINMQRTVVQRVTGCGVCINYDACE